MKGQTLWQAIPLRRLVEIRNSNVDKVVDDDEIRVTLCNYTDVYYGSKITDTTGMAEGSATPAEMHRFGLRPGDIIITKDSETANDIGVPAIVAADIDAVCGYHLTLMRPRGVNPMFLYWVLEASPTRGYFETAARGVTRFGLTLDGIASTPVPLPDAGAQRMVADFLDRETSRIDKLIAKKQRMIELLDEEVIAATAEVVNHGIEPTREEMQSENRWFERIPQHWGMRTLRQLVRYVNSSVDKKTHEDQQVVKVCNYTDVYYGSYLDSSEGFREASASSREIERFALQAGDVLMTKDSETADDIGVPAYVQSSLDAVSGYHLTQIRPSDGLLGEFLYWVLLSPQLRGYFQTVANGVTRFGLTLQAVGDAPIPMPPTEEQQGIARHLRRLHLRNEVLGGAARKQIELLGEYRQALITAAVTGQLDEATLRGAKPIEATSREEVPV